MDDAVMSNAEVVKALRDVHRPDQHNLDRITTACYECESDWPCEWADFADRIEALEAERDGLLAEREESRELLSEARAERNQYRKDFHQARQEVLRLQYAEAERDTPAQMVRLLALARLREETPNGE